MEDPGGNVVRYVLPDPPPLDPATLNRGGLVLATAPPGYLSWGQRLIELRDRYYNPRNLHATFEGEYKRAVRYMWDAAARNSHARGTDDWRNYPIPPGLISRFDPQHAMMDPGARPEGYLDPVGRLNTNLVDLEFFIHTIVKDADLMQLVKHGMLFVGRSVESTPIDGGKPADVNWPGGAVPATAMVYGEPRSAVERLLKRARRGFVAFTLRNDLKAPRGTPHRLLSAHVHIRDRETGETEHRRYRVNQARVAAELRRFQTDPGVHHVLSMRHTTYHLLHVGEAIDRLGAGSPPSE